MPDAPAPVRCDGCGMHGRRPIGHPCPQFWFFLESVDRTVGGTGEIFIIWACGEACRDKLWQLWQRGPGPVSIDEAGSAKMRKRTARKDSQG